MYAQTVRFTPALGKGPELRALLEERVKGGQVRGLDMSLNQQAFAGPVGDTYGITARFQDLAAYQDYRRQDYSSEGFRAFQERLATLVSAPADVRLAEVLVPLPNTPVMQAGQFIRVNSLFPAVGAAPELRALLEESVKGVQASGPSQALWVGVFGFHGPVLLRLFRYQALAELEANRNQIAASPNTPFAAQRDRLLRQPIEAQLVEVLIATPGAR